MKSSEKIEKQNTEDKSSITNILIVDDHSIIRNGLINLFLLSHLVPNSKIDEACDGDSAYEKIKNNNYKLVILDVQMPETDTFSLVENILIIKPQTNILMFSMTREDMYAKRFLQLGAKGFVNKEASTEEIKKAILIVLGNERYLSQQLKDELTEVALGKKSINPVENLTTREFEIFQLLVQGESLARIGELLHIHSSTLGTHKKSILDKLGCKNIVELTLLARVNNIIA